MPEYLQHDLNIMLRLSVALVLAGALGYEREVKGKAAGMRTHMLVGMGSAFFVIIGELFVQGFQEYGERMRFDPIRVVEAVVAGISFLGAGTIFVSRGGERVKGLTTAASIWTTSAVGMAVGLQRYLLATGATLLVLLVLAALRRLEPQRREVEDEHG